MAGSPLAPQAIFGEEEWRQWRGGYWRSYRCNCGAEVWTQAKKCRTCGMKRSYAQAASSQLAVGGSDASGQAAHPVRASIDGVHALLAGGAAQHHGAQHQHHASPSCRSPQQQRPVAVKKEGTPGKEELEHELNMLVTQHQGCKDNPRMQAVAQSISDMIAEVRSDIAACQPIGVRIDSAREAVQRAEKRAAQAREARTLAQSAVEAADIELAAYREDVTNLEAMIATASSGEEPGVAANITELAKVMESTLLQMSALGGCRAEHVDEAKARSRQLLAGLVQMQHVAVNHTEQQQAPEAAASAAVPDSPFKRLTKRALELDEDSDDELMNDDDLLRGLRDKLAPPPHRRFRNKASNEPLSAMASPVIPGSGDSLAQEGAPPH